MALGSINLGSFDEEWLASRGAVLAYCFRALKNYHTAEDVTQQVGLRALRGFPTFQGQCPFLGWVLAIARNQVNNQFERENKRRLHETPWDGVLEEVLPGALAAPVLAEGAVTIDQLLEAAEGRALSRLESRVLRLFFHEADLTWAQIGPKLGISANAAAVASCRAIPKLRVFLFVHAPALLGGERAIAEAFAATLKDTAHPLTPGERTAFVECVIKRNPAYRKAGWQTSLRTACEKVIRRLPSGAAADLLARGRQPVTG